MSLEQEAAIKEKKDGIKLTSNDTLRALCARIPLSSPQLEEIGKEYLDSYNCVDHNKATLGSLAELHLFTFLKNAEKEDSRIVVSPIPDGSETENYIFKIRNKGLYYVIDKRFNSPSTRSKMIYAEYDGLTEIDGLPVVWEVKNTRHRQGMIAALKPERISKILRPLMEYYKEKMKPEFGYVVVGREKQVNMKWPSPSFEEFEKAGGVITGFSQSAVTRIEIWNNHFHTGLPKSPHNFL